MSKSKALAKGDHIIVDVVPKKTESILELPEKQTRGDEDAAKFIVYAVGPEVKNCKVGDRIMFNFNKMMNVTELMGECGIEPTFSKEDGGHFIVTQESAIIAVIEGGK